MRERSRICSDSGPVGASDLFFNGADRRMIHKRFLPADSEPPARLSDFANEIWRFGHRRLVILLRQEGELSGFNRFIGSRTVRKRRAGDARLKSLAR